MLELKRLHDLLVLKITQRDEQRKIFPLAQIVGRASVDWVPEFALGKGYVDIFVPRQKNVEHPYVIEVETGYDLNCSGILQKLDRFRKALTIGISDVSDVRYRTAALFSIEGTKIHPKLCVVIPNDFGEFIPLFKVQQISVFLWEGKLEWRCKKCGKITSKEGPWKPSKCGHKSCGKSERPLRLVDLKDFELKEAYRVP